jgi:hypothetical protein
LQLIVRQDYKGVKASEMTVVTYGFGKTNGVRQWGHDWMKNQKLPLLHHDVDWVAFMHW